MAVTASAFVKAEGQAERIVREFEISWTRTPDGWRIERAATVAAIRPVM